MAHKSSPQHHVILAESSASSKQFGPASLEPWSGSGIKFLDN